MGMVLARMLPEKRDELYARIADYGHSRMIAGVHYRSDIDAGKVLGSAIAADEFAADEDFKNQPPWCNGLCSRSSWAARSRARAAIKHPAAMSVCGGISLSAPVYLACAPTSNSISR